MCALLEGLLAAREAGGGSAEELGFPYLVVRLPPPVFLIPAMLLFVTLAKAGRLSRGAYIFAASGSRVASARHRHVLRVL